MKTPEILDIQVFGIVGIVGIVIPPVWLTIGRDKIYFAENSLLYGW